MTTSTWLGIDLGGTFVKWEHLSHTGGAIDAGRVPTPTGGHLEVSEALAQIILRRNRTVRPDGVGIAVPGHLSPGRDSITVLPNVAGDWPGFPLVPRLHERTGHRPVLLNDARAFAGAELAMGAARGSDDVVFVAVGTGIGGAVAVDGVIVRSRRDSVGELGHTTAVVDGDLCGCGHHGCVEAYAGGAAILARAATQGLRITAGPNALRELAAKATTSPVAAGVLADACEALAVAVSDACAYAGARLVVIGGGAADHLPELLERCRLRLESRRGLLGDVEVRRGALGARAGALGAAFAAREAAGGRAAALGGGAQPTRRAELGRSA
ncbi:MAG TPA: ROK family protein [Propionibacteriaceae bacterium]